jgi:antitoxin MazE
MHTTVKKWGNSIGIRLPKAFAKEIRIEEGTEVDISVKDDKILIQNINKNYNLNELLLDVNSDNIHGEFDSYYPVGLEQW